MNTSHSSPNTVNPRLIDIDLATQAIDDMMHLSGDSYNSLLTTRSINSF